jgi:thiamine pyrophosphate-dependent acetolactate synthase large subunit-like protein
MFQRSQRPLIVAGQGIKTCGAIKEFQDYIRENEIPVTFKKLDYEILPRENPLNLGKLGIFGHGSANLAYHKADLIIFLGEPKRIKNKMSVMVCSEIKYYLSSLNYMDVWKNIHPSWCPQCRIWKCEYFK